MGKTSRCETHSTKHTNGPIKGIVGGVSRERALQAIRNDSICVFGFYFKRRQHVMGSGGLPLCLPEAPSGRCILDTWIQSKMAFTLSRLAARMRGVCFADAEKRV